jgi:hypothetical protein
MTLGQFPPPLKKGGWGDLEGFPNLIHFTEVLKLKAVGHHLN